MTTKEQVTKLFEALGRMGFIAHEDFLCCQTCGCAAIAEEEGLPENKEKLGYVFYHGQDTDYFEEEGELYLCYGTTDYGKLVKDLCNEDIGKFIVERAKELNIPVVWDGSDNTRILLGKAVV